MMNLVNKKTDEKELRTINDLEDKEFITYKKEFYTANSTVIGKFLNYFEISKLNQTFLGRLMYPIVYIEQSDSKLWAMTNLRYGKKSLYVPIDFFTLTETVLSLDVRAEGLFRVGNSISIVSECIEFLHTELHRRMPLEQLRNKLAENYSVIDLLAAFKELIRNYEHTVIPLTFISTILKMSAIDNKNDRLMIYHYFYLSLPKYNRHLLEATIFFLYYVHDRAVADGTNLKSNMDMEGIATVMMPNILLKSKHNVSLEQVPKLVNFMKEFILNFQCIVKQNTFFKIID